MCAARERQTRGVEGGERARPGAAFIRNNPISFYFALEALNESVPPPISTVMFISCRPPFDPLIDPVASLPLCPTFLPQATSVRRDRIH